LEFRYLQIQALPHGGNPIDKVEVVVYAVGGQLMIDSCNNVVNNGNGNGTGDGGTGDGGDAAAHVVAAAAGHNPNIQAVLAQNAAIRLQNSEILVTLNNQHDSLKGELATLKRVVARFANRPAQTTGGFFAPRQAAAAPNVENSSVGEANGAGANNDTIPYEATLSNSPKDLHVLWQEYEFGLQGRRAAKRFTTRERGRVRYKYHRRKVVWDKIAQMIHQGYSCYTAVDAIYRVYGPDKTVTEIINLMRVDRISGGHRELR
jgi:Transcriptional activator of glycolytic enzymes